MMWSCIVNMCISPSDKASLVVYTTNPPRQQTSLKHPLTGPYLIQKNFNKNSDLLTHTKVADFGQYFLFK